jgi:tetratricopeptide (TPR) repeat protein
LSSWKEIAAYLGRDVRTVQRWERTQGLPVHRHRHSRLSTAYALKSELDAWWHNRPLTEPDEPDRPDVESTVAPDASTLPLGDTSTVRIARTGRPFWTVAVLMGVALLAVVAWGGWRAEVRRPIPFASGDWALITALENNTGNSVYDGTVEHVLRQELASSSVVRAASLDRVRDALTLMRRPVDTKVDLSVAREVSVRDGGIRALVAPRLDRVGSRVRLSAEIVTPEDGRSVASHARVVDDEAEILDAIAAQAAWVRRTLGERLPELPAVQRYERVTTDSLTALQLYSKAMDLGLQRRWAPAVTLLESAIEHDARFASAHILLAWARLNTGGQEADVMKAAERARALAAASSEAERLFVEGSYHSIRGALPLTGPGSATAAKDSYEDFANAANSYEALLQVEPTHYWGMLNLMNEYRSLQRYEQAATLADDMVDARPNDVVIRVRAAVAQVTLRGDVDAAAPHVQRARALLSSGSVLGEQEHAWIAYFPAHQAWAAGDVERARVETDRATAALNGLTGPALEQHAFIAGGLYLALGRCSDARAAFEHADRNIRHEALSVQSWQCGDVPAFRSHLLADARETTDPSFQRVMYGARTGLVPLAQRWVEAFRKRHQNRIVLAVADGEVAFARENWAEAVGHFERAWTFLKSTGNDRVGRVAERLAAAYHQVGQAERALQVLESTVGMRRRFYDIQGLHGGMSWIHAQVALADLYRDLGRVSDAARIEDTIRPLLRVADPDLPLLARVQGAKFKVQ